MSRNESSVDSIFGWIIAILVISGYFIFVSASLGLMAQKSITFFRIVFNQALFGVFGGTLALLISANIPYTFWRKAAFYIFVASVMITALVFIPQLSYSQGGARRWLAIGSFSFQPAELLKIGFVIYLSAWLASVKKKVTTFKYGLLPFAILLGITALVLITQPDTGTFAVIALAGTGMYIIAGAPWRYIAAIAGVGLSGVAALVVARPYAQERITAFLNPAHEPLGAGYQIRQSLIAIGSGEWFGRGLGQSIQKFNFLPEPVGDSIFAVFAEEWGFIGAMALLSLFMCFALRGLKIAADAPDQFATLLASGIIFLIVGQSFINIAAMLGVAPLTGMPLVFVSQGGTALLTAMGAVGIILNISRHRRT